eukprot:CAMPEP_0182449216 /NCGR_PEP_ID=MMETSP1172-20130603/32566_1 /TAXON_ID=708627 /ORGANISM="Timspurckia oligopyrenoides, Strain CCMP3278" /LENGTH=964 /DNA_ID=CAMNT_0024646393 /DNA_START=134 /DNA_END=3028 /DNA_ORIENTATION=-
MTSSSLSNSTSVHNTSLSGDSSFQNQMNNQRLIAHGYQLPPEEITKLVDSAVDPSIVLQPRQRDLFVVLGNRALPPLELVAAPELRLAGLRIHAPTFTKSRSEYYDSIALQRLRDENHVQIGVKFEEEELMTAAADGSLDIGYIRWAPDGSKFCFCVLKRGFGLELFCANVSEIDLDIRNTERQSVIARRVLPKGTRLHAILGSTISWAPDSERIQLQLVDEDAVKEYDLQQASQPRRVSPTVESCDGGPPAPARTYQDLLRNESDAATFAHYAKCRFAVVNVERLEYEVIENKSRVISGCNWSPDGRYLAMSELIAPFALFTPLSRFPKTVKVYEVPLPVSGVVSDLKHVVDVANLKLDERKSVEFDAVSAQARSVMWRSDAPSTLVWVVAQDEGDPQKTVEFRDIIYSMCEPFQGSPTVLARLPWRFQDIEWGSSEVALITERVYKSRSYRVSICKPGESIGSTASATDESDNSIPLVDRAECSVTQEAKRRVFLNVVNWEDAYNDPGSPLMRTNEFGRSVLRLVYPNEKHSRSLPWLIMANTGATPEGAMPFISLMDTSSGNQTMLWRSKPPMLESLTTIIRDDDATGLPMEVLVQQQSKSDYPNYSLYDVSEIVGLGQRAMERDITNSFLSEVSETSLTTEMKKDSPQQFSEAAQEQVEGFSVVRTDSSPLVRVTKFVNPAPHLVDIQRSQVFYERDDGVQLNANLFLPPNYNAERDGPLPMIMWSYPREFKSAEFAGQNRDSPHRFIRVSRAPLYWLARRYAILDGPLMPIVGQGDSEPNDNYIPQLVSSAQAAVNYVVSQGIADPKRIAIGGHSYGAFMTANLLCHAPDLFCCGVARSGAYNRTLTPFGFQSEERTLWQSFEVYSSMSPYNYAHKIESPLLLIHGEADQNPGTFVMQSERMYAALKGNGKVARLVLLPHEEHGYRARESVLHTLYEMDQWFSKYVGAGFAPNGDQLKF